MEILSKTRCEFSKRSGGTFCHQTGQGLCASIYGGRSKDHCLDGAEALTNYSLERTQNGDKVVIRTLFPDTIVLYINGREFARLTSGVIKNSV